MAEEQKSNTFDEMNQTKRNEAVPVTDNQKAVAEAISAELSLDDLSDTAVGDKVTYVRPDLGGSEDLIEKFQIFMPDIAKDKPTLSQNGKTEYWKASMIVTYASKNDDGVNNREYISGAKVFAQKDGNASQPNIWYEGSGTQAASLWETVAKSKGIENKDLSPREFMAFLNNKPKVKIVSTEFDNFVEGRKQGKMNKNMPGEFL